MMSSNDIIKHGHKILHWLQLTLILPVATDSAHTTRADQDHQAHFVTFSAIKSSVLLDLIGVNQLMH
jgi:hypothetical protein